jgi:predicted extracellular nuclease
MKHKNTLYFRFLAGTAIILAGAFSVFAQKDYSIAAVQGDKNMSPYENQRVRVSGIVTARTRTGFFLQTPDDKTDGNPNTSEGIFVYTKTAPEASAAIGSMISASGFVDEYGPRAEPNSLTITEISFKTGSDSIQVVSKDNPLPKPVTLTAEDFRPGKNDQLEKYEGMRVVAAELTVTSPTNGRVDNKNNRSVSDGIFYGVLKGLPKPFREPGFDRDDYEALTEREKDEFKKAYPKIKIFDTNPERLRIETKAQEGSQAIDVSAHTELKNVIGVLHYSARTNAILLDAATRPSVAAYAKQLNLPQVGERQFSVAAMNLENFFDDQDDPAIKEDIVTTASFTARMKKISAAVRDVMQSPDVIGVIEAENLAALKRLAERINTDAEAAGKPNPKYEAFLIDGNDGRGIDSGYMVKTTRVKVIEVKQFGKDDKYQNPDTKQENNLNDRPPLMLRASVTDPKTNAPFEFTVVVNHLKSFLGYEDPKQQANVRLKKRLQAELLAKFVQQRQTADPKEKIILIGDFNAFQFNDGIVDVIGTIKGSPAPKDEVMNPSEDLVNPDMIDLVDLIAASEKYSYRFDGNAQVLDHMIVTSSLKNHIHGFGFARVNADFPETFRADDTRPQRFSDHDAAVAYFNLDPKPEPKKP